MKKSIIVSAFVIGAFAVNAQNAKNALQGIKIGDNWSVELKGGMVTPLTHSSFFKDARPAFGLGVGKQLTPAFGMEIQGVGYVNTTYSKNAIDVSDISLLNKFNLMNLFGGYPGTPRLFEIEAVAGIGWMHYYVNGSDDDNSWSTRFGLNLNFNFGKTKAWTVGIKPAVVYDMEGDFNRAKSRFNANRAFLELMAGVTYHFKGSNGKRYFTKVKAYDKAEVDRLNAFVNDLRDQLNEKDNVIDDAKQKIGILQQELDNWRNRPAKVETVVDTVVKNSRIPESVVTFKQGKSTVDLSQLPNIERVALYLEKHVQSTVVIKGFASPEGNLEFNKKLAQARAEAVKSVLVKKYKIDPNRITAQSQGIGDMFSEPDWNRISICSIVEP